MGWLIYGAGGCAKVVIETLEELEHKIDYIFDDTFEGGLYEGHPTGKFTEGMFIISTLLIAIGNNKSRKAVADRMKEYSSAPLIHPKSFVSKTSEIGNGTLILSNASIQSDVKIGEHAIINMNAKIDHGVVIGSFVQIAPGAYIAPNVRIGEGAFIGANAVIRENKVIAPWEVIAPATVY